MDTPSNLGTPRSADWARVQDLASRFERATRAGNPEDWEKFLPPRGDSLRGLTLNELVKIDLELRWRRGEAIQLEDYVRRFPELITDHPLSPRLLYEEYRVRQLHGDHPPLDVYGRRYPEQFSELQRLVKESRSLAQPAAATPAPAPAETPAAPPTMRLLAGTGYRLLDRLGKGAFGEVWRAEAPGGFPAAVKVIIQPLEQEEARRELKALNVMLHLSHPYLLRNEAAWVDGGRLHIAMELAEGSLRDRDNECRAAGLPGIPLPELLRYFREAAEALDYLHAEDVLHRDIKPENILLLKRHAKVADFGLARLQGHDGAIEISATFCGTMTYMPPETWRNKVSPHSDQYSLAYTYAELRMGRRPFQSTNMAEAMIDHLQRQPDLDGLPEKERAVLFKALAKEPADRYPTCQEFVQALERALDVTPMPANRPGGGLAVGLEESAADDSTAVQPGSGPGWREQKTSSGVGMGLLLALLLGAILLAGGLTAAFLYIPKPTPPEPSLSLKLEKPDLMLTSGTTKRLVVQVQREHLDEQVTLRVRGLPGCVSVADQIVPSDQDHATIELTAGEKVTPGIWDHVTVQAEAGERHAEAPVKLTVCFLPPGWKAAPEEPFLDSDGKPYFKVIEGPLPDGGPPVRFLLIYKTGKKEDPATSFYMMENKVSVRQFRWFQEKEPDKVQGKGWDKAVNEEWPVFNVSVEDAYHFARWLGGNLPSAAQWDKASGAFEKTGAKGPYTGNWDDEKRPDVATGHLEVPRKVSEAKDDLSPVFQCRDMAGNGIEWTRTLVERDEEVPLPTPDSDARVIERGRSYDARAPWQFVDRFGNAGFKNYSGTSDDLGFRVVIEP